MRRVGLALLSAVIVAAVAASASASASSSGEDGERLDGAMEAFNDRMTEADWRSMGSIDELDDDAAIPTDGTSGVLLPADEERLRECAGELIALFPGNKPAGFPGQTAISLSDTFTSGSSALSGEVVAAVAISVDDESVTAARRLVEEFGSQQTADCLAEAVSASDAFSDAPFAPELDVVASQGLGIGDASAGLRVEAVVALGAASMSLAGVSLAWAHVGNDVAGIVHASTAISGGGSSADFDVRGELQRIVESLGD